MQTWLADYNKIQCRIQLGIAQETLIANDTKSIYIARLQHYNNLAISCNKHAYGGRGLLV